MTASTYENLIGENGELPEYKFDFNLIIDGNVNSLCHVWFYCGRYSKTYLFIKLEHSHITHSVSIVLLYQYTIFDILIIFYDALALR